MHHILISETLTVICTKAKLMVISNIIQSQFDPTSAVDIMQNSSLLVDAAKHAGNYCQIFKSRYVNYLMSNGGCMCCLL
jgi:hypothetical protein